MTRCRKHSMLWAGGSCPYCESEELRTQLAEAQAKLQKAELDAARYRWLRDVMYVEDSCLEIGVNIRCHKDPNKADIDAAIDAAMEEAK